MTCRIFEVFQGGIAYHGGGDLPRRCGIDDRISGEVRYIYGIYSCVQVYSVTCRHSPQKDEPNTGLSSKSASDSSCDAFDAKKLRHGARRTDSRQQPKKYCIKYTSIKMCHTSTTTTPVYIIQYIIWPHRHEHARVHSRGDVEQHVVMLGEQGVFEVHAKVQDGQHSRQPRRVEDEAVRVERVQRYQSLTRQGQRARFVLFCFTQKSKSSVIYIYIYIFTCHFCWGCILT